MAGGQGDRRPVTARRPFLTAEWRALVLLNFDIAPGLLQPFVPPGTTLDLWRGQAVVSVVGFLFLNTRLGGIPLPFHQRFEEVNLRFYVRRELPSGECRRGVTFVKEFVPQRAVALVARAFYNEPYQAAPMRSTGLLDAGTTAGRVSYEWRVDNRWQRVSCGVTGPPVLPPDDDERTFIAEHYWGYGRWRDGSTGEYEVRHPRWRVWNALEPELDVDVARLYGPAFVEALSARPVSAFVAEGSPVEVYPARRLL